LVVCHRVACWLHLMCFACNFHPFSLSLWFSGSLIKVIAIQKKWRDWSSINLWSELQ
jgi:hypothetical protein